MKKIIKWLLLWNEWFSLPLAAFIWWISPVLIRYIDPTAATFDSGVLQTILLAAMAVLTFNGLAWLGISLNFFGVFRFYADNFKTTFNTLDSWQKIKVLIVLYLGLLFAFVLSLHSL